MGCSVSKREVTKPTKYPFLPADTNTNKKREIKTEKDEERKANPSNYSEYRQGGQQGPPTDLQSVSPAYPTANRNSTGLSVILEGPSRPIEGTEHQQSKAVTVPILMGMKRTPMPIFSPASAESTFERCETA